MVWSGRNGAQVVDVVVDESLRIARSSAIAICWVVMPGLELLLQLATAFHRCAPGRSHIGPLVIGVASGTAAAFAGRTLAERAGWILVGGSNSRVLL